MSLYFVMSCLMQHVLSLINSMEIIFGESFFDQVHLAIVETSPTSVSCSQDTTSSSEGTTSNSKGAPSGSVQTELINLSTLPSLVAP